MDLSYYLYRQKKLDDEIMRNCGEEKDLLSKKVLALQTEVAEFANATRCFKYWSKKAPEPRERQLDEWVDIFHFLLSIANHQGYTSDDIEQAYDKKNQINANRQKAGY